MKAHQGSLSAAYAQGVAVPKALAVVVSVPFCFQIRGIRVTRFSQCRSQSQSA
jgi:hypothetical protein